MFPYSRIASEAARSSSRRGFHIEKEAITKLRESSSFPLKLVSIIFSLATSIDIENLDRCSSDTLSHREPLHSLFSHDHRIIA